ncbi:MAG: hypothetical protein JSR73_05145 [Proteobacteria bacterium]|nr:hypothetical protein [Pseudomonadota bacterium]
MKTLLTLSSAATLLIATSAFAVGPRTDEVTQRDVNQQQRIEQGLQSGQLNTKEAGQLEREQSRIDRTEARDLKDGKLSASEQAQINRMQNKASADIYRDKHNAATGNPNSASSQRMQADVQRNVNQQKRIEQGEKSGTLTNREAGSLERGQAHVDAKESRAARNGHVSAGEQAGIQKSENRQSKRIFRKKHNQ